MFSSWIKLIAVGAFDPKLFLYFVIKSINFENNSVIIQLTMLQMGQKIAD